MSRTLKQGERQTWLARRDPEFWDTYRREGETHVGMARYDKHKKRKALRTADKQAIREFNS